jgi:hypothetical protein
MRFRCKVCHKRVTIKPIYSRDNREILLRCTNPKCLAEGVFRNKDFVPFLFVKNIKVVSRVQFFGVLSSHHLFGRRGF